MVYMVDENLLWQENTDWNPALNHDPAFTVFYKYPDLPQISLHWFEPKIEISIKGSQHLHSISITILLHIHK